MKKGLLLGAVLGISLSVLMPLAYSSATVETLATLSGVSTETIEAELEAGSRPAELALSYDVVEAFKERQADNREAMIQRRIERGNLSEEEANQLRAEHAQRMEDCDGEPGSQEPLNRKLAKGSQNRRNP